MKKGSKAAKAWGAKMRRLRGTTKRKKSTRKGGVRKTARRAYVGLRKRKTQEFYKMEEIFAWMELLKVI